MRNILVFPDGTEHDFMYPVNREVNIGDSLQIQMTDDSIRILRIREIEVAEKKVYYYLEQT